jgi:Flp pilus assembly protein TadG
MASMRQRRSETSRWSERGASIVEFALLAPVFVLLVLGIVDFGVELSDNIALRQGVREGARQGVVGTFGSNSTCTITGTAPPTATKQLMCLTKGRIGGDATKVRVMVDVVGTYTRGNSMLVCGQRPMESVSGMFAGFVSGRFMKTKVEMRIDDLNGTSFTDAAETAPTGSDWSWCA